MNESDFLLSEVKRMQRFHKPDDLANAIVAFVDERYYPKVTVEVPAPAVLETPFSTITLEKIKEVVLPFYNISWEEVTARNRKPEVVKTRMKMMYFLRTRAGMSLTSIGKVFKMDHSSVIYGRDKLIGMMGTDWQVRREIEYLNSRL